jgi:hypothetical protein
MLRSFDLMNLTRIIQAVPENKNKNISNFKKLQS